MNVKSTEVDRCGTRYIMADSKTAVSDFVVDGRDLLEEGLIDVDRARPLLEDLQGNILRPHGREHTVLVLLRFPRERDGGTGDRAVKARQFLGEIARSYVVSAWRQEESSFVRRKDRTDEDRLKPYREQVGPRIQGGVFVNIFLTHQGYDALGVSTARIPSDPRFKEGMKASRERLNDPPSETWERPYQGSIDAMILVADDDPRYLERVVGELLQGVLEIRPELSLERGKVLRNDEGDSIEHFGYVDGISQPIFFETSQGSERDTRVPLKDVLVEEPGGIGKSYGSYLVFRKLEQDVSKFRCLTRKLVRGLRGDRDAPSSPDEAGALVVGRSLDGTPRIEPPAKSRNDFRFDGEKNPPTHAHIRKTNPRDDSEKRIVRRGVPYGERTNESLRWDGFVAPPSKGVGLLFLCFQSDIGGQFEWIQERANDPDAGGLDPIIGQLPPGQVAADAEATRQEWGTHRRTISFHGVVKLRGGEYFFAPSVSFLQELAAAPTGSTRA